MASPFTQPDDTQPATLGGARRAIEWEALDATAVDATERAVIGERWRARQGQEHLAVGAFSQLAWQVAAHGGEPVVLALLTRAASDEVRHAEICRRTAAIFLGEHAVPARLHGVPRTPPHAAASSRERTLYHVVEMCCLSETFTGVYFTEALAHTVHPTMRAILESLLEDEIDHGRVGWAHLASVARGEGGRAAMSALSIVLPDMLDRTIGRALRNAAANPEPDSASRRGLGHLANAPCIDLLKQTVREVILPGFEQAGVDLGPAHAVIRAHGWS
jgi:hypothetical protein